MEKKVSTALRRTAAEVKVYRRWMHILPLVVGVTSMVLVITFVISALYNKYGSFTVQVTKYDFAKYALTLSENPEFRDKTSLLNSKASKDITNIDGKTLPQDLDAQNGEHNGANYVAYTFYCMNCGSETVTYEYELYIVKMTLEIEKAVRIRLYVNGEMTDYARTRTDGTGPEEGTTEFMTGNTVTRGEIANFKPGDYTKYTVVIWLEGPDEDCVDKIIGGQFRVDMSMKVVEAEAK